MFYCVKCKDINEWTGSLSYSYGVCEICGDKKMCIDRPSSSLPDPKHIKREKIIDELLDDI